MNIFKLHAGIIEDYKSYIESFLSIKDDRIKQKVDEEIAKGQLWPEPLIQFNPTFQKGKSVSELTKNGLLDNRLDAIFKDYNLYRHQVEAIQKGIEGKDFKNNLLQPRQPYELPMRITKDSLKGNRALKTSRKKLSEEIFPDGYILFDGPDESIWNDDKISELPDTWRKKNDPDQLDNFYEYIIPHKMF